MANAIMTRTVRVLASDDHESDLLLDLGQELCDQLGWQPGDQVEWIDNQDGTWTIQKKT